MFQLTLSKALDPCSPLLDKFQWQRRPFRRSPRSALPSPLVLADLRIQYKGKQVSYPIFGWVCFFLTGFAFPRLPRFSACLAALASTAHIFSSESVPRPLSVTPFFHPRIRPLAPPSGSSSSPPGELPTEYASGYYFFDYPSLALQPPRGSFSPSSSLGARLAAIRTRSPTSSSFFVVPND